MVCYKLDDKVSKIFGLVGQCLLEIFYFEGKLSVKDWRTLCWPEPSKRAVDDNTGALLLQITFLNSKLVLEAMLLTTPKEIYECMYFY